MITLDEALLAVNQAMYDVVESDVEVLQEASRHIISAGGKRVRPRMMFLAYQSAGGQDLQYAVPVAAAIELVHTATLVHDDINDHGTMRRGRVTINEKWGRTFALLTGDFLFAKVYELMAPYRDINVTFAEATVALVEGETYQAYAAKNNLLNHETYQKIIAKKTASLFRAGVMMGAQLAGAAKDVVDTLGEYGFYVGLIFQVIDDLLDLEGDERLMGKSSGVDLEQGKGVASVVADEKGNGHAPSDTPVEEEDPFLELKRRMVEKGAVEEARKMAQELSVLAHAALDKLPQSPYIDGLREIITLVLDRDH